MKNPLNIIFMGTPDFAVPVLHALHHEGHHLALVVTQPDRPKGRGKKPASPAVKVAALRLGLPVIQPESIKDPGLVDAFAGLKPDVMVVVAYGQILPKAILDISGLCAVNIHASLLPKYRGPAPIQWAVINGEKETGVCTMKMAPGLDTGDILMCKITQIDGNETSSLLHDRLSEMGAEVLIQTLEKLASGNIKPIPQDSAKATYAPMLKKEDGRILWSKSARELHNFIRGISPWPGAFTFHGANRLKIVAAEPFAGSPSEPFGTVIQSFPDELKISTGDGGLSIIEIQGPSGKRLAIRDFLRGYRLSPGDRLE
ncbi:MAG: methionyl-tRNA formyltransferase [Desulfobacteraceae bacterium]|nr:methionyl-tRNA formyltransferase [Desulfobacteraceae bacterium]